MTLWPQIYIRIIIFMLYIKNCLIKSNSLLINLTSKYTSFPFFSLSHLLTHRKRNEFNHKEIINHSMKEIYVWNRNLISILTTFLFDSF